MGDLAACIFSCNLNFTVKGFLILNKLIKQKILLEKQQSTTKGAMKQTFLLLTIAIVTVLLSLSLCDAASQERGFGDAHSSSNSVQKRVKRGKMCMKQRIRNGKPKWELRPCSRGANRQ